MYKVSCYCKLMSVKIKSSSCKVDIARYYFVFFQCPARTFAVCKAYIAAVINKLVYCYRSCKQYSFFGSILYFKNIESRFCFGKCYCLQSITAENNFVISAWIECICVSLAFLSKIAFYFNNTIGQSII